jgi:ubiquitin thioesterase OTU1
MNPTVSTVSELKQVICLHAFPNETIVPDTLIIKSGYPAKIIPPESNHSVLASQGIANGEQLIVESPTSIASTAPASVKYNPSAGKEFKPSKDVINGEFINVPEHNAVLMLRQSADDNNCLFHSISYTLTSGTMTVQDLRKLVIQQIETDPAQYSEIVLGRPVEEYCRWIAKTSSWGIFTNLVHVRNY